MSFRIASLEEVIESEPLIVDGWLEVPEYFVRIDGHPLKVYSRPNTGANGLACHSIVGKEADGQDGVPDVFLSDERNPDGSFKYAKSCMFILRQRMLHVVMYPIELGPWTSGSGTANTTTWPSEAEGGLYPHYDEPLTPHQEEGFIIIATAWEQENRRRLTSSQLLPHWLLVRMYGGGSTQCESGRYKNAWARVLAGERYFREDVMPSQEYEELRREIDEIKIAGWSAAEEKSLGRAKQIEQASYRIKESVEGRLNSINDRTASALKIAMGTSAAIAAIYAALEGLQRV